MTRRCIALLGGSFDPVHNGHVALGKCFVALLAPDVLRLLPAGNPWQKQGLQASGHDRVEMLRRAFSDMPVPVDIDEQEIKRTTPTYTIETLRLIRAELGDEVSLIWLLGADQLQHLDTWQEWQHIFDYAHLCVAPRPGFAIDDAHVPATVAQEFARRAASVAQLRDTPHGLTYLATNLAVDISATEIRAALHDGQGTSALMPPAVLDYIQQHHLYKS